MARPVPLQARLRHGGDGRSQARGHTESDAALVKTCGVKIVQAGSWRGFRLGCIWVPDPPGATLCVHIKGRANTLR